MGEGEMIVVSTLGEWHAGDLRNKNFMAGMMKKCWERNSIDLMAECTS
jgi:hypothetical protein